MSKTKGFVLRTSGMILFLTLLSGMVGSGCEPLRKKFVRKKKVKTRSEVVPVLDPQDYPAPEESPLQLYRQNYSLWKVWHKDLITAFEEQASDKRKLYLVDQLIVQLQRLQDLAVAEPGGKLGRYVEQLEDVRRDLQQVSALRNEYAIKSQVLRVDKDFRMNFSPSKIQDQFPKD